MLKTAEIVSTHWEKLYYYKKVLIPQSGPVITFNVFSQSTSAKIRCLSSKRHLEDHVKCPSRWPWHRGIRILGSNSLTTGPMLHRGVEKMLSQLTS